MEKKGRLMNGGIAPVDRPDDIQIAVMGGTEFHAVFLPGFSHQTLPRAPVSRVIAEGRT